MEHKENCLGSWGYEVECDCFKEETEEVKECTTIGI